MSHLVEGTITPPPAGSAPVTRPIAVDGAGRLIVSPAGVSSGSLASSASLSFIPVMAEVQYLSSSITLSHQQFTNLLASVMGALLVRETEAPQYEDGSAQVARTMTLPIPSASFGWSHTGSNSFVMSGALKAAQGNLRSLVVTNGNPSFSPAVQLWNQTTTPTAGQVLSASAGVMYFSVPAASAVNVPGQLTIGADIFGDDGVNFSTGIALSISAATGTNSAPTTAQANNISWRGFYI